MCARAAAWRGQEQGVRAGAEMQLEPVEASLPQQGFQQPFLIQLCPLAQPGLHHCTLWCQPLHTSQNLFGLCGLCRTLSENDSILCGLESIFS